MNTYENGILTLSLPVGPKTADVTVALMIQREQAHNSIPWETVWNLGDSSRHAWIHAHATDQKVIPATIVQQIVHGGTAHDIRHIVWFMDGFGDRYPTSEPLKEAFLASLKEATYQRLAKVWNAVLTYSSSTEMVVQALPETFLPMALVILNKRMKDDTRYINERKRKITELITQRLRETK